MGSESGDLALKSKWGIGEDQLDSWLVRFANLLVMYEWEIELTVRLLDLAFSGGWLQKDSTLFEILLYLHQHTLTIKQMDMTIKQVDMLTVFLKSFYGFHIRKHSIYQEIAQLYIITALL